MTPRVLIIKIVGIDLVELHLDINLGAKKMLKSILEIYNSVWSSPLSKLAIDWNINPTLLAKICDEHFIPRPPNGYWIKLSLGKSLPQTPLPNTVQPSDTIDITPLLKTRVAQSLIESVPTTKVTVPKTLHRPHRLTQVAKELYKKPRLRHDRLMEGAWLGETYRISVSPGLFQRALIIMDTLLKEFEKRGWQFEVKYSVHQRHPENVVRIDGNSLTFKLREKLKQTKRTLTAAEESEKVKRGYIYYEKVNEPTGDLMLILEQQVRSVKNPTLDDSKKYHIEDKLGFFLDWIIEASDIANDNKVKRRKEEEIRQKQRDFDTQINALVAEQESKIDNLFSNIEQWQKIEQGRQFLNAVKTRIAELGEFNQYHKNWLAWANNILNVADPIGKVIKAASFEVIGDEVSDTINIIAIRNKFGNDVVEKPLQISRM
jgi:hypothetical protein